MEDDAEMDREIEIEETVQDVGRAIERAEQFIRDARALMAFMDHPAHDPSTQHVRMEIQRRLEALKATHEEP